MFTKDAATGRIFIQPTDVGFEFGVIVDRPDQLARYSFALATGGYDPSIAPDGATILLSQAALDRAEATTVVGGLSAPVVLDAHEVPAPSATVTVELYRPGIDPIPPADVSSAALASLAPGEVVVSYALDAAWLADPTRAFPIVVDPNACLGEGASGCTINGTATNFDHFVASGIPTSYPSGWSVIRVGDDVRSDDGVTYNTMRGLVYFDPVTLPDAAVVYDADLKLHISSEYGGADGRQIWAYRVKRAWGQTTTWNFFNSGTGGYSTTGGVSLNLPASGTVNFDADAIASSFYTRRAKDWKAGLGFALKMNTESGWEVEFDRYNDANTAYRPLLELDYTIPSVAIDFASGLGANYSPSTMIKGQATKLPIIVTNKTGSAHTLDKCTTDGDCWKVGYRWFDEKSNLVGGGDAVATVDLPADITVGNASSTFLLPVTPPSTVGQYTLLLDLVHLNSYDWYAWASDWATPSKFYSRNKKVLTADSTRWAGSSKIERDEFSINVVAGGGSVGETETVTTGDGGSLGINLYSKNLAYRNDTGLGFADRMGLGLTYGYNSADATSCTAYQGILGACGWSTNWDERISGGSNQTGFDYTYQDPSGERYLMDTDADGQIVGGAPVLINRPRATILDENGGFDGPDGDAAPDIPAVLASGEGFSAFSGSYVGKVASSATVGFNLPDKFDLNTYHKVRFAFRTTSAASSGLCFLMHNLTDSTANPDRWWCYTVGTAWNTGFDEIDLGLQAGGPGGLTAGWNYYDRDLYQDVKGDGDFGGTFDDFQVTTFLIESAGGSGSTYLDGFRLETTESAILDESDPSGWTTGGSGPDLTSLWTGTSTDPAPSGSYALRIDPAALASSPTCRTSNSCWSSAAGGLWSYAFAHWHWRKAGGQYAAVQFWFTDQRSGAPCNASQCVLTYYAGAVAPPGATYPIQVSPHTPTEWTLVRRNILEDARTVFGLFDDAGSAGPDDVKLQGYGAAAIDGNYLLVDALAYGSLADTAAVDPTGLAGAANHPSSAGDGAFTFDYSVDQPDGSRHYLNRDGLLVRIRDRDGQTTALDWTYDTTKAGPGAYTLTAIHAPSDGSASGGTTFDRQFTLSRGTDGTLATIRVDEVLGSTSSDQSARAAIFETATTSGETDLAKVSPARHSVGSGASGTFCGTKPNGCAEFSYTTSTSHRLEYVADPRWDGTTGAATEYRWRTDFDGSNFPIAIRDMSHGTGGTALLKVLTFSDVRDSALLYIRPLWQDAAAAAKGAALAADLSSDGRVLTSYAPRPCTSGDCSSSANWPTTGAQSNYKTAANEFDGLARVSTTKTYRCPAASDAVDGCTGTTELVSESRQGSNAGAKVDNYNDPLAANDVPWTQSADQLFASLRDSGGTNPDLYRTESLYDGRHQRNEQREPRQLAGGLYGATAIVDAPTGYWRLDETFGSAADSSGNGKNGTYTNGPTLGGAGALIRDASNRAPTFDGTNDYMTVAGATMGTISGTYALEVWAKPADTTGTYTIIGSRGPSNYGVDLKFMGGTTIHGDIGSGSAWLTTTADAPLTYQANRWYHIVVRVGSGAYTIYVDGKALGSGTYSGTALLTDASHGLYVGQTGNPSFTEYFKGSIDEVAVYSAGLTSVQIESHLRAARATAIVDATSRHDSRGRLTESVDQLVANGGFEDGWDGWVHPAGTSIVTGSANSGAANASFGPNLTVSQTAQLTPGETVRFQYYAKSTASAQLTVQVASWLGGTWSTSGLVSTSFADASWTGHAWDLVVPVDSDGRLRLSFFVTQAGSTGSLDDVVVMTGWAKTDYNTSSPTDVGYGLQTETTTLRPCPTSCTSSTIKAHLDYAAGTTSPNFYPAIFPTSSIANYMDGTPGPAPDVDVQSQTTFDPWGRSLVVTDPDGVTSTTHYGSNQTDVDYTADGLGKQIALTYDRVGNRLTVTTPKSETTTTVYDALNHPLTVTAPTPIATVTKTIYNAYGQATTAIANDVNDVPSSAAGVDDLVATTTYNAFGHVADTVADTVLPPDTLTGAIQAKTTTKPDQTGAVVATTQFADSAGTDGRTTTNHFETYAPPSGTPFYPMTLSRLALSGVELPTGAPTGGPICPDSVSAHCNSLAILDLSGQTTTTYDGYNKQTRLALDLAGRTVQSTVNVNGTSGNGTNKDQNLVTTTVFDISGRAVKVTDPAGRAVATAYDALGRPAVVTRYDSAGTADTDTKTVYRPSGRTDLVSSTDHAGTVDASRSSWTKTVYDVAGRAVKTLAHYDTVGLPQIATDNFEDGITTVGQIWTNGSAGVHTAAGGSSAAELGVASPNSGEGRLRVTTGTGANTGSEWALSGSFKLGRTYKARAYVNAPSGTTVTIKLGTSADANTTAVTVAGNDAWQGSAVLSWSPTADRTGVALAAIRTGSGSAVTFYVDDVIVWDNATPDVNIPTETVYDDDGHIVRSIVVPGDPTSEASLVTRTDYDVLGRTTAVVVNDIAGSGGTSATTFTPSADAHVKSANTANNYGTLTTLQVRADAATPNDYKPYLKFSVTGLGGTVTNVKLRLNNTATSNNSGRDVCIYPVTDTSWIETGITWANAPSPGSSLVCVHGNQAAGWIDYDLGTPFSGNGTYSYAVFQTSSTSVIYSSKEGANAPQLVVSTGGASSDPAVNLSTTTTYDALGRADTTTNPRSVVTKFGYDRLGRPTAVWLNYVDGTPTDGTSEDDDVESTFAYDALGEQTSFCPAAQVQTNTCDLTDPAESQAWHYVFDKLGRMTKQIPPDNASAVDLNTSETVYEAGGYVDKTCTYPAGGSCASTTNTHWTDITNDDLGRTLQTVVKDRTSGSDVTAFTFTTGYNVDGTAASVSDGSDTLTYFYDNAGRLHQFKRGSTVLTELDYAADGMLSARQDGGLAKASPGITYDWAKRPVTVPLSTSIATGSVSYSYRLDGLLKTKSLPGGTETATLAYDAAKRPISASFTIAGSSAISQTYDRTGNVATEARNLANAAAISGDAKSGTLTYSYDKLNRLTGSTGAGGTRAYRYDLDSNRVYKTDPARTLTYTFDRTDQQINETNGSTTTFVFDAFGNLTKKAEDDLTQTTLAYDAANRLTSVSPASGSAATFTFDALSRNNTRGIGGSTTDTYGYLGPSETVYEVATTGGITRTIDAALGPDGSRLAVKDGSGFGWTLFDLHGDLAALENQAMSSVTDALRYDGYGATIDTDGSFGSPWKFQGALDVASGTEPLYDIGARMYAPSIGAWTSLDSVVGKAQNPISMNRFLYAEANPATLIDPTGHAGCNYGQKCHSGNTVFIPHPDGTVTVIKNGKSTTSAPPPASTGSTGGAQTTGTGGAAPINALTLDDLSQLDWSTFDWDRLSGCTSSDPCLPQLACVPGVPACVVTGAVAPVSSFHCDKACQDASLKGTGVLIGVTAATYACAALCPMAAGYLTTQADSLKNLLHSLIGERPAVPFQAGETFMSISTKAGEVQMMANAEINGGTLVLRDIAIGPGSGQRLDLGVGAMIRLRDQLASLAAEQGFDTLRIVGARVTGANPGKIVDVTIDLAPFK